MKNIITLILFFLTFLNSSQNLVPNGSFEVTTQCPFNIDNLHFASPWCQVNAPDLFNSCNNPSQTGVPENGGTYPGYQYCRTGNGMAGFNVFVGGFYYRENACIALLDTMQNGKNYCISFYVNLLNCSKYAVDRLGIYISKTFYPCDTFNYNIALTPTIESPLGTFLSDTLNWLNVGGIYSALGGEKYITIGNFYDDTNTNRILFNPNVSDSAAYYYLDDVSIEEIKPVVIQNDTTVTFCDTLLLGKNLDSASTYTWWPNNNISDTSSPNPRAWPDSTITYYVTKIQCSSVTTDSIKITVMACDVGIGEAKSESNLKLYPNPFSEAVTFSTPVIGNYNLRIYDLTGKLIDEKKFTGKQFQYANEKLTSGIYIAEITNSTGEVCRKKIIKD